MDGSGAVIFLAILGILVGLYLIALPVKLAAAVMGAERTGTFSCLFALIIASVLHGFGLTVPVIGTIIAFFLSALGFAVVLGTDFFRGIGIAVLHIVFSAVLVIILLTLFGASLEPILSSLSIY